MGFPNLPQMVWLARSRSLGPRGPLASSRSLSPPPRGLKSHCGDPPSFHYGAAGMRFRAKRVEGGHSKVHPPSQRPLRRVNRCARMCSLMFAYVRICSDMFGYVRITGKKVFRWVSQRWFGKTGERRIYGGYESYDNLRNLNRKDFDRRGHSEFCDRRHEFFWTDRGENGKSGWTNCGENIGQKSPARGVTWAKQW